MRHRQCYICAEEDEPPLRESGVGLGDMTSELKANEYISKFVSDGPKNYAYELRNSVTGEAKLVCRLWDIGLNYKASQIVNFETIKNLVVPTAPSQFALIKKSNERESTVRLYQ